jgi:predicted SAM-dependent methyltransferase
VSLRERRTRKHIKSIVKEKDTIFLELGAGDKKGKGEWLTIDLNSNCDVVWNLINGIPFPDNSVHKIYSSHLFEHFSFKDGQRLLDECKRVLIPGGIFSICVPNAKLFISAYLSDDNFDKDKYLSYKPANNCTSKIDCVNYIAYMDGHHKYMFDEENIIIILKNKGFKNVKIRDFDRNLDLEKRDWQSIYAQGEK